MALGFAFVATRELAPAPAAAQAGPPRHSRLLSVLDGVMAVNTTPAQVEVFRTWVEGGATRDGWPPVESIVANSCSRCHDAGGQFPRLASYGDLRPIALEETPQGLMGLLRSRPLHLFGFPAVLLLISLLYLRRTAWPGKRALMVATAAAVGFDLAQWMLRQGAPTARWAAWSALVGLAAVTLVQVGAVLTELWRPREG
jgi:cytochrome c553